jgi:hypothetical protein
MATAYVLRRDGDSPSWLKRQAPAVTWGPLHQALRFRTEGAARRAAERLRKVGPLTIEQIDASKPPAD